MSQIFKNEISYSGNVYDSEPVGEIIQMAGDKTPPGYIPLEEERKSVLRSAYPDLFKKIGTKYGATDELHFNLPAIEEVETVSTAQMKEALTNFLNIIYPVGSIYMSVNSTSPSTLFGGEWESIGSGKVLQGVDEEHAAGTTIEAGLPNITGKFGRISAYRGEDFYQDSALYKYSSFGADGWTSGGGEDFNIIGFDASKSNNLYGKSDTVQPPAYVVYMWKRTA